MIGRPRRSTLLALAAATVLSPSLAAPSAGADEAATMPCGTSNGGLYGLIESASHVSCSTAKRVAAAAYRTGAVSVQFDCRPPRTVRYAGWRITGPLRGDLRYRWTKGNRRFVTTRQTDCL